MLERTPQSSTVIRVFLVDVILLALILCWPIGIRSGILNFSMPLRVLLVVLWVGAICVASVYGILPFRSHNMPIKFQFSARLFGLSLGILVTLVFLLTLFGIIIPFSTMVCIWMPLWLVFSSFSLPRWEDKRSVALAGALCLMCALLSSGVVLIDQGLVAMARTQAQLHSAGADPFMYALFGIAVVLILLGVIGLVFPQWKQKSTGSAQVGH
jgi:hypothetical protein